MGIYYSQINATTLFTIGPSGEYIHMYDLSSLVIMSITKIRRTVNWTACLASSETPSPRLYITGGDSFVDYNDSWSIFTTTDLPENDTNHVFQILDLDNQSWTLGDDINFARRAHGCITMNDTLWIMGYVAEIETVNITDVYNTEWAVHSELRLENNLITFGLVAVDHYILIIGGLVIHGDYMQYSSNIVYIIDTVSDSLTTELLPNFEVGIAGLSAVVVDNIVYGFGGFIYNADEHIYGIITDLLMKIEQLRHL